MLYAILFLYRSICILLNGSVNFMDNVVGFLFLYYVLCLILYIFSFSHKFSLT